MIRNVVLLTLAAILTASSGVAMACEYKRGESKYAEYASCVYGDEAIVTVDLPENNSWEQCVYLAQAFRPPKLLAVTKEEDGKEQASINDRAQIGNPCYLTKQACDKAYKAAQN
jgi:DNA-binding NarL/FixJ family response regulator